MNKWVWLPLVVLLAGCGAQAQPAASSAGMASQASGDAAALYKKAQAEGQVAWYMPTTRSRRSSRRSRKPTRA